MPRRLGDLEMAAYLVEFLARREQLVALGELADDLIRRVPPALVRCHVVADSFLPRTGATESHNNWTTTAGTPHRGERSHAKTSESGERRTADVERGAPTSVNSMRRAVRNILDATLLRGIVRRAELDERLAAMGRQVDDALVSTECRAVATTREHTDEATAAVFTAALAASREHTDEATAAVFTAALATSREHAEELNSSAMEIVDERRHRSLDELRDHVTNRVAEVRRAVRHLETQQGLWSTGANEQATSATPAAAHVSSVLYADIEDRFRGAEDDIAARQGEYLVDVDACLADGGALIDIGSGRGEWLSLLTSTFPNAELSGIDTNEVFVAESREAGLDVTHGDALTALQQRGDETCDVVTMFHVAEHLPLEGLDVLCGEINRVLRPGGLFICETPNCASLSVGASTFWIDPTHPRPLHPEVLRFIVERAGFTHVELRELHPITPDDLAGTENADPKLERIIAAIWGHGDIAVVARR